MGHLNEIEKLIEEYIQNIDMNNILNLKVIIPGFKGSFNLYTDKQLRGRVSPSQKTELCFLFSFQVKSKKSVRFLDKITESDCMKDFEIKRNNLEIECVKKTNNDPVVILKTIHDLVENIFPGVNHDAINIELSRITQWGILSEK